MIAQQPREIKLALILLATTNATNWLLSGAGKKQARFKFKIFVTSSNKPSKILVTDSASNWSRVCYQYFTWFVKYVSSYRYYTTQWFVVYVWLCVFGVDIAEMIKYVTERGGMIYQRQLLVFRREHETSGSFCMGPVSTRDLRLYFNFKRLCRAKKTSKVVIFLFGPYYVHNMSTCQ